MTDYETLIDSSDRDAWLLMRRTGIGASDTASIMRVPGAWGSPLSVAAEKLTDEEPKPMSEYQEAGLRLEQTIAEWAAETIGDEEIETYECSMFGKLCRSKKYPWMLATPDALISNFGDRLDVPLQCKNTIYDWSGEIPPHVLVQVLHEMIVLNVDRGYAATLQLGNRLRWGRVNRADHVDLERLIIEETGSFWEKIQNGNRIEPDGRKCTREAIAKLWPSEVGKEITLDGSFVALDAHRMELLQDVKNAEEAADEIGNQIREAMRDAEVAYLSNGVTYTYKQGKRSRPLLRKAAKE
ncbi:MAG TPA: YqaJ viral recombinase family protein [Candidatus Heimdallarchaeota archaeon]|nr:YqaJ viral recombinase family protein [Candidatus Heimdallarchaeota archaeon]